MFSPVLRDIEVVYYSLLNHHFQALSIKFADTVAGDDEDTDDDHDFEEGTQQMLLTASVEARGDVLKTYGEVESLVE